MSAESREMRNALPHCAVTSSAAVEVPCSMHTHEKRHVRSHVTGMHPYPCALRYPCIQ